MPVISVRNASLLMMAPSTYRVDAFRSFLRNLKNRSNLISFTSLLRRPNLIILMTSLKLAFESSTERGINHWIGRMAIRSIQNQP